MSPSRDIPWLAPAPTPPPASGSASRSVVWNGWVRLVSEYGPAPGAWHYNGQVTYWARTVPSDRRESPGHATAPRSADRHSGQMKTGTADAHRDPDPRPLPTGILRKTSHIPFARSSRRTSTRGANSAGEALNRRRSFLLGVPSCREVLAGAQPRRRKIQPAPVAVRHRSFRHTDGFAAAMTTHGVPAAGLLVRSSDCNPRTSRCVIGMPGTS